MNFNGSKFSKIIRELIKFKSGTTHIPISAASWEELIWATLVFMYGVKNVDWDSQSHEKSVDIKAKIGAKLFRISAKGGNIKNGLVTTSSYRLTTFADLKDKLQFIKNQHKKFNFYLICVREIKKDSVVYTVIKTNPDKMAPGWMTAEENWEKTKNGYELNKNFGFNAKIVSKMSNQLWYEIPFGYFSNREILTVLEIPKEYLGTELIKFLKRLLESGKLK